MGIHLPLKKTNGTFDKKLNTVSLQKETHRVRLGDVCRIVHGKNQRLVESNDGPYPIYGSGGQIGRAAAYLCPADTVIIGRKGTINRPLFIREPFWNVDTAFGLVANQDILLPEFLFCFCLNFDFSKLNKATTIPSLTKKDIANVEMLLPSRDEQQWVANKVSSVSSLVKTFNFQLALFDNLVKSRFIEMFGDPVSNSKALPTQTLASVAPIESDSMPKSGAVWLLNLDAIESGTGRILRNEMTEAQDAKSSIVAFSERHVLISKLRPYLNKVVIPHSAGICTSELLPLLPNKDYLTQVYLAYALRSDSFVRFISQHVTGAKMPRIDLRVFKSFEIPIPEMSSQLGFEGFVTQVDKLRFDVQRQVEKLETLKKSLMQEYFG